MTSNESLYALRRANPRTRPGFERTVEEAAALVSARLVAVEPEPPRTVRRPRGFVLGSAAGLALAGVAAAAIVAAGSFQGTAGVEDATAAVRGAATLTAASAERSGAAAPLALAVTVARTA
jgi:hypothetical protein